MLPSPRPAPGRICQEAPPLLHRPTPTHPWSLRSGLTFLPGKPSLHLLPGSGPALAQHPPSPQLPCSPVTALLLSPCRVPCSTRMQICIICLTQFCSPGKQFLREFVLSLGVSIPVLPQKAYQKCQWLDVRHGEFSAWEFVPCSQTSILHGGGRLGTIT